MRGMVHPILQRAIKVGECLGARSEPHAFAEIVATLVAVIAVATHDACFNGDTLTWDKVFDAWTDSGDDACCLVAKDEWSLDGKVAISACQIVMHCRDMN